MGTRSDQVPRGASLPPLPATDVRVGGLLSIFVHCMLDMDRNPMNFGKPRWHLKICIYTIWISLIFSWLMNVNLFGRGAIAITSVITCVDSLQYYKLDK